MNLVASSPETFKYADMLKEQMMEMMNLNGALRGAPPSGASSGVAIATLSANAIEFSTSLQESLDDCLSRTIKHAINCYIVFGPGVERKVMMSGTNNQVQPKTYTGENLKSISGIKIATQNPLMQTIAGRLEVGEKLLQMPKDLWGKYVSILEGQPLQKMYQDELTEDDLIEAENEELSKGVQVPSLITDDHPKHIQKHAAALSDPKIRMQGQMIQLFLAHIEEHYNLALQQDPSLTAMIRTGKMPEGGLQPMPPPQGAVPPGSESQEMPALPTAKPADDLLEGQR
jgi:hypothetical protein